MTSTREHLTGQGVIDRENIGRLEREVGPRKARGKEPHDCLGIIIE